MRNLSHLNQPLALFGGTFDPVHLGHIAIALEIQQAYRLGDIYFVLNSQPVHRTEPHATVAERLAMLTLALQNHPSLKIDDSEIQRRGPSYTIDTLEAMRIKFPKTPFCFILGLDAWLGFTNWHRYEEILKYSHLIIATRPQYVLPQSGQLAELLKLHQTTNPLDLQTSLSGKIIFHATSAIDISATEIRQKIARGENPQSWLAPSVYDYIVQHHLYLEKK